MKLRAKDSVPKMYSFSLWLYSFLMVVQLFKNIYMRTTEFVQLWKKLCILVQTQLWMKLRAKDSVPKMYSFFLWLYSFLIVVQLFKNIHMRTTEFVQLWKKLYILVRTPLWMKLRAKDSVPKMYSFFLWLYSFLMVVELSKNIYEDHRICTALEKTVHFGTNTIVNEIKSQGQCTKDVQLFSLVVQLFNGCTAF